MKKLHVPWWPLAFMVATAADVYGKNWTAVTVEAGLFFISLSAWHRGGK